MAEMDGALLGELVRELYELSPENRAFMAAWPGEEEASVGLLSGYKAKITAQFVARGGGPRMKGGCDLALCRRLIKDYRRMTAAPGMRERFDVRGTIDLGLHYLEAGTGFINKAGWDDVRPYNSMGAVLDEIVRLCETDEGRGLVAEFVPRVKALAKAGYGFGDDLEGLAAFFEETAAADEERAKNR